MKRPPVRTYPYKGPFRGDEHSIAGLSKDAMRVIP